MRRPLRAVLLAAGRCILAVAIAASALSRIHAEEPGDMVVVPGGDFWMGRTRLWLIDEIGWQMRERMDDRPVHRVTLAPFSVDVHEVSNADFAAFVSATAATAPYHWAGTAPSLEQATLPVYNVSWHDAVAYCQWAGKRLPTEAEWEKAARGGMPDRDYPWGNDDQTDAPSATPDADTAASEPAAATRVTHAHSASATGPRPVGSFEPNGFGLYDMSGNVWEWVSDWYDLFYYAVSPIPNPTGPADGAYKVIRGGSWADTDPRLGAVYFRNFTAPELRSPTVGFRCARSVDPR